jgi:hypothetical protein
MAPHFSRFTDFVIFLFIQEYLEEYFDTIREGNLYTEKEIIQVKAALWAVVSISWMRIAFISQVHADLEYIFSLT